MDRKLWNFQVFENSIQSWGLGHSYGFGGDKDKVWNGHREKNANINKEGVRIS